MSRPFAEVKFNASRKHRQTQPQQVWVYQREYLQDVAVIELLQESHQKDRYKTGRPVTIRFGWLPNNATYFHGYVHHTKRIEHERKPRKLHVYCIGASYPMRMHGHRSWNHRRSNIVVSQVAREHRFSATTDRDSYVMPHLTQHGKSDWAFCVSLAKRRGFTFYANNTHLYFKHRRVVPSRRAPSFIKHRHGLHPQHNSVYTFHHAVGETVPFQGRKVTRVQHVVTDAAQHQRVVVHPPQKDVAGHILFDPLFAEVEKGHPMASVADARANLEGLAVTNRFHIGATAKVSGDQRVHQGMTIRLGGLDKEDDGYWWVNEATHHITLHDYQLELHLGRDSMGAPCHPPAVGTPSPIKQNPVVVDGCADIDAVEVVPETIYEPVDDCVPVVEIPDPVRQFGNGWWRPHKMPIRLPKAQPCAVKVKPPRLHAWRARTSRVTVTR